MKILYLIRHAKSSWDMNVADWERSLTQAGIERAQVVAGLLKTKKIKIDCLLSSHAFRALNTAVIFARTLNYPLEQIEISNGIYEKKATEIIALLRSKNDKHQSIMLFGHNPAVTELYNMLTGRMLDNMGTSAAAGIEFNIDKWTDLAPFGKTIFLETGKE